MTLRRWMMAAAAVALVVPAYARVAERIRICHKESRDGPWFTQLCDDPLDPRVFTDECIAAGIGQ